MGSWNGLSLQTYFAQKFGDNTATFKALVLEWLNDIQTDIASRHIWDFTRERGKVLLKTIPAAPTAPTVALAAAGSLTVTSVYSCLVTFVDSTTGLETVAGAASSSLTVAALRTINLTAIPVSTDSRIDSRNIYLKKDSGLYYYHSTISNNTGTTASIATDTTVKRVPPVSVQMEVQNLYPSAPTKPTATIAAGGSLAGTDYYVLLTYAEGISGLETVAGTASAKATTTVANKQIALTGVPVSTDPLVTERRIYLKKDTGEYLYHSTISNNTATTATVDTDTTSTHTPPDCSGIRILDGAPFLESSGQLLLKDLEQLRRIWQGTWSSGTPSMWAQYRDDKICVYPIPVSPVEISFYYFKIPPRLYAESSSVPILPVYLKQVLEAGMIWKAHEYRDRDGQETKKANYYALISDEITVKARGAQTPLRVRDLNGDSDGFEIN
jgi:hypothetical protein